VKRLLKGLVISAWGIVVLLVIASLPDRSLLPDRLIALLAFIFVPIAMLGSAIWLVQSLFSHSMKK
jgi:hypothetical protein